MAGVVKYHGTAQVDHPPPLDPYACVCYSAYTSSKGVWTRIGVCLLRGRILGTANRPRSIVLVPIHQAPKSGPLGPSRETSTHVAAPSMNTTSCHPRTRVIAGQVKHLRTTVEHPPSYPCSGTLHRDMGVLIISGFTLSLNFWERLAWRHLLCPA